MDIWRYTQKYSCDMWATSNATGTNLVRHLRWIYTHVKISSQVLKIIT